MQLPSPILASTVVVGMGNCLVREERRAIKNGEILSYQTPLMAQQVRDESEAAAGARAIRIKLVVTKQELKEMLRQGGVSHDAMASLIQREESRSGAGDKERCMEWRPTLESIPEWIE